MDTKRISSPVLSLVYVVFMFLSQSKSTCPENQVLHRIDRCCQYISCKPQHYVRVCDTEGGADVCVPCGPTAYLDDPTDSNFVFDCLEKNCGEDTVPIDFPATKFDGSACSKRCQCNPAKNYCGTDPCRCQYTLCSHGETLLQNCTCVRKVFTPSTTTQEVTVFEPPLVIPTGQPPSDVTDSDPVTVHIEKADDDGKTSIIKPDFPDDRGSVSNPENNTLWMVITFISVLIGGIVIAVGTVFIRPRRRNNASYSSINVFNNNNTTVNNYQNSNVQIGNKNTQNVHESVSENESAASTDAD